MHPPTTSPRRSTRSGPARRRPPVIPRSRVPRGVADRARTEHSPDGSCRGRRPTQTSRAPGRRRRQRPAAAGEGRLPHRASTSTPRTFAGTRSTPAGSRPASDRPRRGPSAAPGAAGRNRERTRRRDGSRRRAGGQESPRSARGRSHCTASSSDTSASRSRRTPDCRRARRRRRRRRTVRRPGSRRTRSTWPCRGRGAGRALRRQSRPRFPTARPRGVRGP